MRYPASEKLEIIQIVEQSHLSAPFIGPIYRPSGRWTGWAYRAPPSIAGHDRYQSGGPEALEDRSPKPSHVWNRIPDKIRDQVVELALDQSELAPRELAVRFTDTNEYARPLSLEPMAFQWLDIRIISLPAVEGYGSDYQPCIHRDQGCQ